jgi:hypothetical protein
LLDNNKKLGYRHFVWAAGNNHSGTETLRHCGSIDMSLRFTEADHPVPVVHPAVRAEPLRRAPRQTPP